MTARRTILKFAAVACSALLAGGFIAYRAGAFDHWVGRKPTDHVGGTKIRQVMQSDDLEAMKPTDPAVMSGTKTLAPIIIGGDAKPGEVEVTVPPFAGPK